MARVSSQKSAELEAFWRFHLEAWQRSPLNQREYCELHGLPLKRFGNWRATLGDDGSVPKGKLLWRRGGGLNHMTEHMTNRETTPVSPGYIPSGRTTVPEPRRNFNEADKKRIVEEACRPGNSVSGIARRYGDRTAPAVQMETGPVLSRATGNDIFACHGQRYAAPVCSTPLALPRTNSDSGYCRTIRPRNRG